MKTYTDLPYVREFVRLCDIGDRLGFHERNGGNLTVRLETDDSEISSQTYGEAVPLGMTLPHIAHRCF